ncbi:SDR family NAD(P)-dependent oxidoreductase [Halosaccharopolyspora lacisalsi]|uniref:SDR family NAD(P)-dependent oxidoreductase n=1 Tax=Halosaccharopolyspora lacisalsi TaxID=1000566 RepID=UPI001C71FEA9
MARFTGKRVLITGCTSGIGLAGAKRIAAEDGHAIVTGTHPHRLAAARQELPQCRVVTNDADPSAAEALAEEVADGGGLDGVWLDAGYAAVSDVDEVAGARSCPPTTGCERFGGCPGPCRAGQLTIDGSTHANVENHPGAAADHGHPVGDRTIDPARQASGDRGERRGHPAQDAGDGHAAITVAMDLAHAHHESPVVDLGERGSLHDRAEHVRAVHNGRPKECDHGECETRCGHRSPPARRRRSGNMIPARSRANGPN